MYESYKAIVAYFLQGSLCMQYLRRGVKGIYIAAHTTEQL